MKIVIVGGGVIGCTLAYFLTHSENFRDEDEVILIEETEIASAASGKAGGFLASNWCQGEDIDHLCQLSFKLHQQLANSLNGTELYDFRLVDTISCVVSATSHSKNRNVENDGIPKWITAQVVEHASIGSKETNAQVNPRKFTECMLQKALASGKCQVLHASVQGILNNNQLIVGDKIIDTDAIILSMGPWTFPAIKEWIGFPNVEPSAVYKIHSIELTTSATATFEPVVIFGELKETKQEIEIVPRPDGTVYACGYHCSEPLPKTSALVHPNEAEVKSIVEDLNKFAPNHFKDAALEAKQACYLPSTKDHVPVIGEIKKGVFVAAGHGCWGILNAPGTAQVLSELLLTGKCTSLDIEPFSPLRFTI